jgi:aspartyl protease family protein
MNLIVLGLVTAILAGLDAAALLDEKGLRRETTTWVLQSESDLNRALRDIRSLDRKVKSARKDSVRMAKNLKDLDREIEKLTRRRRAIGDQLPGLAGDPRRHNQAVAKLNQIGVRLTELYEYKANSDEPAKVAQTLTAAGQGYIQHLLNTRRVVDEAIQRYTQLAADQQVGDALSELGRADGRTYTLGPSQRFLKNLQHFERLESVIQTDRITMRRHAGTWWVPVVFNREITRELLFDSGASTVSLPARIAAEIGIMPSVDDTRIRVSLADGSVVEAASMTIPFMRVGLFEATDVRCIVLPPEFPDAPALLGGSFINRFGYTIDTGDGTLTLHRIEDSRNRK